MLGVFGYCRGASLAQCHWVWVLSLGRPGYAAPYVCEDQSAWLLCAGLLGRRAGVVISEWCTICDLPSLLARTNRVAVSAGFAGLRGNRQCSGDSGPS
jgi:hypothetical protein